MKKTVLNGKAMTDRASAYAALRAALSLPDYFGDNLDALYDVLSAAEGTVELKGTAAMLGALESYGCKLLACFYDAARENPRFTFRAR
ncbi:MAG: barstar family protein [Clostridia bacterium]|nr:barstar family protein [Clostridia bacterium]